MSAPPAHPRCSPIRERVDCPYCGGHYDCDAHLLAHVDLRHASQVRRALASRGASVHPIRRLTKPQAERQRAAAAIAAALGERMNRGVE